MTQDELKQYAWMDSPQVRGDTDKQTQQFNQKVANQLLNFLDE